MSQAWETTEDDVETVLKAHGIQVSSTRLTRIHDELDMGAIEAAALCGDDMDEQTNYAYQDMEDQLKEMGVLSPNAETKFEN
jgi:ribosomal protein L12E/L44/L45/RPP1/RPP2